MELGLAVIAGLLALLISLYWYLTNSHNYWKDQGIPYVSAIPIVGSVAQLFLNPMQDVEVQRYKKYGRMFGHYEGKNPVLNVADPDLLRDIFIKDFPSFASRRDFSVGDSISDKMVSVLQGEDWKRVRTIITPAFTTGKIKKMMSIILDSAKTLAENFDIAAKDKTPIEAKRLFGAFSMDVIASSAFATKLDSHNDPNNEFVVAARKAFLNKIPWRFALMFIAPKLMKFFTISPFTPSVTKFFKDVTLQIIAERRRTGQTRNDFLQLLMDAQSVNESSANPERSSKKSDDAFTQAEEKLANDYGHEETNSEVFKSYYQNKGLSSDELVANCVIFFLAGYDTTASTLSFISYNLALNPDCQEKLIAEVDESLRKEKGKFTYEAIQGMKYLDMVISETLRLFPPAIRLERVCDEDYNLGTTGFTVPKGMIIGIPVYAMHHDPEFFPEPEKFIPTRFDAESKARRHPYTYLPFGAGPRNCLGMRFALMEIKMCLAYILSRYRLKRCPETKVPLEFYSGQGLMQPKSIKLSVEKRSDRVCE